MSPNSIHGRTVLLASLAFSCCVSFLYSSQNAHDRALGALQRREYSKAVALLQEQIKRNPKDEAALNLLGIALAEQDHDREAADCFRKTLVINPRSSSALKNLALLEWKMGRRQPAVELFRKLLEVVPGDEVAHAYLGIQAFELRDYRVAVGHWQAAPSIVGMEPRLALNLAAAYLELKNLERARKIIQDLEGRSRNQTLLFQAAVMLAQFRQYEDAIRLFLSIRNSFPDRKKLEYNLALAYSNRGDHERAKDILDGLLLSGVRNAEVYRLLVYSYKRANRIHSAMETVEKALSLFPADEDLYLDLAAVQVDDFQDLGAGIRTIQAGIQKIPNSVSLRVQLGILLFMQHLPEQAQKQFDIAAQADPKTTLPTVGFTAALMRQGELDQAIEILRSELAAKPDDSNLLLLLGTALMRRGFEPESTEAKEALRVLEKAAELNPQSAISHTELGKAYAKLDRAEEAAREFETAIRVDPGEVAAYYQLGLLYNKKGEAVKAQAYMAKAAQINRERNLQPKGLRVFRFKADKDF